MFQECHQKNVLRETVLPQTWDDRSVAPQNVSSKCDDRSGGATNWRKLYYEVFMFEETNESVAV